MSVGEWELVACPVCGSLVLEILDEDGTPAYNTNFGAKMTTIGELMRALEQKNPDSEFEILVQNNPDHATNPHAHPEKIVILVAEADFMRLN